MRPLKTAFLATLAAFAVVAPPAMSVPHSQTPLRAPVTQNTPGNSISDHMNLIRALARVGVRTKFNDMQFCNVTGNAGAYFSRLRTMLICQDNARQDNVMSPWTENDLDTVRHEAHHVVQDCARGRLGDAMLSEIFTEPQSYNNFVITNLGHRRASKIAQAYGEAGKDQQTIFVEVEAFAVAHGITADTIANKVIEVCRR